MAPPGKMVPGGNSIPSCSTVPSGNVVPTGAIAHSTVACSTGIAACVSCSAESCASAGVPMRQATIANASDPLSVLFIVITPPVDDPGSRILD
jgi:hypothetical protein